jgi:carboxypeptidase C (cathepsin A)
MREYAFVENGKTMEDLKIPPHRLNIPLFLICHTPEVMKKEIEYYGNASCELSNKVERLWVEIMREYLKLSANSIFIQAKNSGHMIHFTDPESILGAIELAVSTSPAN